MKIILEVSTRMKFENFKRHIENDQLNLNFEICSDYIVKNKKVIK